MEHLINLDMIRKNEDQLKHRIFTSIQLNILKKKLEKKKLNNNEKTYYYKYIKPKVKAMLSFFNIEEINIKGKDDIIEKRKVRAIEILKKMQIKHKNKKILITGSFLFNKNYDDIDVFVFTKYNKEDYKKGKIHVNFIKEDSLDSIFFSSLCQISISNFYYNSKKEFNIKLKNILHNYELLINHILNKEDYQKELRDFLLQTEYVSKSVIFNSKQLHNLSKKVKNRKIIEIISNTLINSLVLSYRKDVLNKDLKIYIKEYKLLLKQYKKSENLKIYIQTYEKAIKIGF